LGSFYSSLPALSTLYGSLEKKDEYSGVNAKNKGYGFFKQQFLLQNYKNSKKKKNEDGVDEHNEIGGLTPLFL
jgi:hypothetical protein